MTDQLTGDGMPEAPIGGPQDDDLSISNTGQRIRAILVVIIVVAIGVGIFVFYTKKQKKVEAIEKVKTDFAVIHSSGYEAFWKAARLDLDVMKTNADFEAKIKEYLAETSVAYAKHVKEKALPVLEEAVPKYKAIESPNSLAPEVKAVADAVEALLEAWKKFSSEIDMYENYLETRAKLDDAGGKWLGAQGDPKKEEYTVQAVRYVNLVHCILVDKTMLDFEPVDLSYRIKDTCALVKDQADWFKRVAFGCLDKLNDTSAVPDELYNQTLLKYSKADDIDSSSKFGITQCLDLSRKTYETELSDSIAMAWANYAKAKNELLAAIKEKKKEI